MATIMFVCILCMALKLGVGDVNPETIAAQNVLASILNESEYDKRVRPRGANSTTVVSIIFYLLTVNDLDSVSEKLETTAYLEIEWQHDRLAWEHDKIPQDKIAIPQDEVWRPDVTLKNSISDIRTIGDKYQSVTVFNDSWVAWYPYQVFKSNCDLNIQHFPFDVQTCSLEFSAWSYYEEQVSFANSKIDTTIYQTNNLFDLLSSTTEIQTQEEASVAIFTIQLRRKPLFVFLTTVIPIITLAVLANCVFLLPFDCGEKISYAVTVFLAFMVTLAYVTTILPENSDTISYLAMYVTSQVIQSTVQTLITIILCMLHYRDEDENPIPKWLMFMGSLCCLYEKKLHRKNYVRENSQKPSRATDGEPSQDSYHTEDGSVPICVCLESRMRPRRKAESSLYSISGKESSERQHSGEPIDEETLHGKQSHHDEDAKEIRNATWKQVVNRLDVFFFVFFIVVFIICTTLYVVACIRNI